MKQENEPIMYLIVRNSLGMKKGKIGAQTAHAAIGIFKKYLDNKSSFSKDNNKIFDQWMETGTTKIVLKANDDEWMQLKKILNEDMWYIVRDAGRTQVEKNSETVIAMFPLPKNKVPSIIEHMSLL